MAKLDQVRPAREFTSTGIFARERFNWVNIGEKVSLIRSVAELLRGPYEINFNRYFHTHTPPHPLEKIEADHKRIEAEIAGMLAEVTE
ncbi:MAG: hypothetical protein JJU36_12095 [Phycisphaeraceae bacterium]|nr:hypothetical protein [Phycisphaeraceae bacterium]